MFGIEIDFLTGRYTAHSPSGYGTREWPPHPGRFFSALVAAYHEHDFGTEERAVLEWIENLPAPKMSVPEAHERDTVTVFVPHYDSDYIVSEGGEGELVPEYRASSNKPRKYPTVLPADSVYFIWETEIPENRAASFERLVTSVPYFGDSSSLVHARIEQNPPKPTLIPASNRPSEEDLRVPGPGRLRELEQAYEKGQRPPPAGFVGYTSDVPGQLQQDALSESRSEFGANEDLIVLKIVDGPKPPLEVAFDVTAAVRRALFAIIEDPIPTWISGHTADGDPAQRAHVAFVPLSNIAHPWADGSILGIGLLVPDEIGSRKKATLYEALNELRPVRVGSRGEITLHRVVTPTKESLKRQPYVGSSTLWISATPYVYDRYPDSDHERDKMIATACEHIGLPRPRQVHVIESGVSPVTGVPRASNIQLSNTRFSDRPRCHTILQFDDPVQGPITIGCARYLGIGLMRSLKRKGGSQND